MIGYPYSYGNILTPEMARNNRKRAVSYSVLIPTIWWHNLGFGEPIQSYSYSSGGKFQTEISRVLEQESSRIADFNQDNQEGSGQPERVLKGSQTALQIPSGGDGTSNPTSKFGPGSKAKGAAQRDFARRQTRKKPTSGSSGGSLFAESFSPKPLYGSRPTPQPGNFNIPKTPSGRYTATINDRGVKNQPKSKSPTSLKVERPTSMPHQDFVNLTKEERRQLPHSKDMKISHDGHPELTVGYWQAKYKLRDHGAVHGLSYTVKANGGTQTEKTEDNLRKFIGSIADIPNRSKVKWFDHGTYQGGTNRGFDAVHIYDLDNQIIAVFRKDTGRFVTSCQLDRDEHIELLETGNFGGGKGWVSGQIRNLPPVTPKNSFENDIKDNP